MLLNIYMMLKMTRKLQKVLGLVQQKLIIDYNYRLVVSIYIYQEENRFKSSITPAYLVQIRL